MLFPHPDFLPCVAPDATKPPAITKRRPRLAMLACGLLLLLVASSFASGQVGLWTWTSGSSHVPSANKGQPGNYGILGTLAPTNVPGGRLGASAWTDHSGILWLFGGGGFDAVGTFGTLNDLWEFNVANGEWT